MCCALVCGTFSFFAIASCRCHLSMFQRAPEVYAAIWTFRWSYSYSPAGIFNKSCITASIGYSPTRTHIRCGQLTLNAPVECCARLHTLTNECHQPDAIECSCTLLQCCVRGVAHDGHIQWYVMQIWLVWMVYCDIYSLYLCIDSFHRVGSKRRSSRLKS